MHLLMILTALAIAWSIRQIPVTIEGNWEQRWQRSLFGFLFPPLILLTTVLAVIVMGAQGEMLGFKATELGYWVGFAFLVSMGFYLGRLTYQAWLARKKITAYPEKFIRKTKASIIDLEFPYIAQVGLWQPKLVVSQGLLDILDKEQLEAVLAHEQAHLFYRDTFSFFLLGWLRDCTAWLHNTDALWEELLLLREIRADLKAAETVDALVLAETLLTVAKTTVQPSFCFAAGFSLPLPKARFSQRIDALINDSSLPKSPHLVYWSWLLLLFAPWGSVPFHY